MLQESCAALAFVPHGLFGSGAAETTVYAPPYSLVTYVDANKLQEASDIDRQSHVAAYSVAYRALAELVAAPACSPHAEVAEAEPGPVFDIQLSSADVRQCLMVE